MPETIKNLAACMAAIVGSVAVLFGLSYATTQALAFAWEASRSIPWPFSRGDTLVFVFCSILLLPFLAAGLLHSLHQWRIRDARRTIADLDTRRQHAGRLWMCLVRDHVECHPRLRLPFQWDGSLVLQLSGRSFWDTSSVRFDRTPSGPSLFLSQLIPNSTVRAARAHIVAEVSTGLSRRQTRALAHTLLDAQFTSTGRYSAHERIAAQYRTHQPPWASPSRDRGLPSTQ